MIAVIFLVVVFGLVAYVSSTTRVNYDTSKSSAKNTLESENGTVGFPKAVTPTFLQNTYMEIYIFLQDVFVLYLIDHPTNEEKKKVKDLILGMNTSNIQVVDTFSIEKRIYQRDEIYHAKSLVILKNRVILHHAILERKNDQWKIFMSGLASQTEGDEFLESFTQSPSYVVFPMDVPNKYPINSLLLV
jgi:hypothetical protein